MRTYQTLKQRQEELRKQRDYLTEVMQDLPPGTLMTEKNGKKYKYFQVLTFDECRPDDLPEGRRYRGKIKRYIKAEDRAFARQLAVKAYCRCMLRDIERELKAIHGFLFWHREDEGKAAKLLMKSAAIRSLLEECPPGEASPVHDYCRYPLSSAANQWLSAPFEQFANFPEEKKIRTSGGLMVRSKAEALIAGELYRRGIPFRYECALPLDEEKLFPDFTIFDSECAEILIWEHFGKMDDPKYCARTLNKIRQYIEAGYVPGKNFIMTFETLEQPLDYSIIISIIEHFFS